AVDDRNNVFTGHTPFDDPTQSYVQRLTPNSDGTATVTRWSVPGSGVGLCGDAAALSDPGSANSPCISGIAVHPTYRNLIYYSEPSNNAIAELNIGVNPPTVRRWSFMDLN